MGHLVGCFTVEHARCANSRSWLHHNTSTIEKVVRPHGRWVAIAWMGSCRNTVRGTNTYVMHFVILQSLFSDYVTLVSVVFGCSFVCFDSNLNQVIGSSEGGYPHGYMSVRSRCALRRPIYSRWLAFRRRCRNKPYFVAK